MKWDKYIFDVFILYYTSLLEKKKKLKLLFCILCTSQIYKCCTRARVTKLFVLNYPHTCAYKMVFVAKKYELYIYATIV